MPLFITDFKVPQNFGMRRPGTIAALSQKPQFTPLTKAFQPYVQTQVPNKAIPGGFHIVPTHREFGIFPMSRGTQQTNKAWIHALAANDVYTQKIFGLAINDQRQITNMDVAGLNVQRHVASKRRFKSYPGNSQTTNGRASMVKHADNALKASGARTINLQLTGMNTNPIVIDQIRRTSAYADYMRGGGA